MFQRQGPGRPRVKGSWGREANMPTKVFLLLFCLSMVVVNIFKELDWTLSWSKWKFNLEKMVFHRNFGRSHLLQYFRVVVVSRDSWSLDAFAPLFQCLIYFLLRKKYTSLIFTKLCSQQNSTSLYVSIFNSKKWELRERPLLNLVEGQHVLFPLVVLVRLNRTTLSRIITLILFRSSLCVSAACSRKPVASIVLNAWLLLLISGTLKQEGLLVN